MAWKLPSLVEGITKLTKAWVEELVKKEEESSTAELGAERTRAEGAEGTNATAIATEKARAEAAEALGGEGVTPEAYEAKGNVKIVHDGAMAESSPNLKCATSKPFALGDVGKTVNVIGASRSRYVTTFVGTTEVGKTITLNAEELVKAEAVLLTSGKLLKGVVLTGSNGVSSEVEAINKGAKTLTLKNAATKAGSITITATTEWYPQTLVTTIKAYKSTGEVELNASATRTTSAAEVAFGTDDTKAMNEAAEAAAGKILQLKPGANYGILGSGAGAGAVKLQPGCTVEGYGATVTQFAVGNTEPNGNRGQTKGEGYLFGQKEGAVLCNGVTFYRVTSADEAIAYQGGASAVECAFENCRWRNGFSYAVKAWGGSTTRVNALRCEIEGYYGYELSPYGSMGISHAGKVGGELIVTDCYFHKCGLEEDFHQHCVYIYIPVALQVTGCRFNEHQGGRYITVNGFYEAGEESASEATKLASYAPAYFDVTACEFGGTITSGVACVMTNPLTNALFSNCFWRTPSNQLQIEGAASFTGCGFLSGTTGWLCGFGGSGNNSKYAYATFTGCTFSTAAGIFEVLNESLFTSIIIRLVGGEINVTQSAGSETYSAANLKKATLEAIGVNVRGTMKEPFRFYEGATLKLLSNHFEGVVHAAECGSATNTTLVMIGNGFDQTSSALATGSTPTKTVAYGNYGAKNYAKEGFFGGTPVERKAAGAETTKAIWERFKELGLCE